MKISAYSGITLVEVAFSLVIVSFAIASAMLLYPVGIRVQTQARFQIYASAKALEMVDAFTTFHNCNPAIDSEAPEPWQVPSGYSNLTPDLERRLSSYRFGIFPLPLQIAKRLDSDNDEIAKVLSDGGHIYYSQPMATTGFKEAAIPESPPNEVQRLVFAVAGFAQQNAIQIFPWKAWPYYMTYPSPPSNGNHLQEPGFSAPSTAVPTTFGKPGYLWEDTSDSDIRQVFRANVAGFGYQDHQAKGNGDSAKRYCQAALWYCAAKGLPLSLYNGQSILTDFVAGYEPWKQVQALRFLSHATTCLTTYFNATQLNTGIQLAPVDVRGDGVIKSQTYLATTTAIQNLHESCLNLATSYASRFPYDWAVPRPLNRAVMMDHPLLQWDLYSPPRSGQLFAAAIPAQQWKALAAQPVTHIGRGFQFMHRDIDPGIWGDQQHFTLTDPFEAAERCRQLVFWSVDWQSYEDFETLPSAPVDASKYPSSAPTANVSAFAQLMSVPEFRDWHQFGFRNPEKALVFTDSAVPSMPTGSDVTAKIAGNDTTQGIFDQGAGTNAKKIFSGMWGADRNCNHRLDRGPLPKSQRLRATTVLRFNFYDSRVPGTIR